MYRVIWQDYDRTERELLFNSLESAHRAASRLSQDHNVVTVLDGGREVLTFAFGTPLGGEPT